MATPVPVRPPVSADASPEVSFALTPVSPAQAARAARPPESWTAEDVCAYVTEEIGRIHGEQLPGEDPGEVLAGWCERTGIPAAVRAARYVFEVRGGMWRGAPVTLKRFTPGHDSFFSDPIIAEST